MKRFNKLILGSILALFLFIVGCVDGTTPPDPPMFDSMPTTHDLYFTKQISFADTNLTAARDFVKDKVAILDLKSVTDGDTADFHIERATLNGIPDTERTEAIENAVKGGSVKSYISIRFLGVDTPESTSAIQAWGKKAAAFARTKLEGASQIIVDASSCEDTFRPGGRFDSNGTRWLGLIWYTTSAEVSDYTQYRLLNLELIEECYSRYTGGGNSMPNRILDINRATEPILYERYIDTFGTMTLSEVMFEAENRMASSELPEVDLRKFGSRNDPDYDYSRTPRSITIADAVDNFDEYEPKATLISVRGVITAIVGNNFYLEGPKDTQGNSAAIYVYMGINGSSIEAFFGRGDTIDITGRLASFGGQMQLSDINIDRYPPVKVTNATDLIPMPAPIELTNPNPTEDEMLATLGKLVRYSGLNFTGTNAIKNGSYTVYTNNIVKYNVEAGDPQPTQFNTLSVRINPLAPGYEYEDYKSANGGWVIGVMGIYQEQDLMDPNSRFASYQVVPYNRVIEKRVIGGIEYYVTISAFSIFPDILLAVEEE